MHIWGPWIKYSREKKKARRTSGNALPAKFRFGICRTRAGSSKDIRHKLAHISFISDKVLDRCFPHITPPFGCPPIIVGTKSEEHFHLFHLFSYRHSLYPLVFVFVVLFLSRQEQFVVYRFSSFSSCSICLWSSCWMG